MEVSQIRQLVWMSKDVHDIFALVINLLEIN
jgi:hypothetical protein